MAIQQTALRRADDAPGALSPEGIMQLGLGFSGSKTLLSAVELASSRNSVTATSYRVCLRLSGKDSAVWKQSMGIHEPGRGRRTPSAARREARPLREGRR